MDDAEGRRHVGTLPTWVEGLRRYWLLAVSLVVVYLTLLSPLPEAPPSPSAPAPHGVDAYTRPLYSRFSQLRDVVQQLPATTSGALEFISHPDICIVLHASCGLVDYSDQALSSQWDGSSFRRSLGVVP